MVFGALGAIGLGTSVLGGIMGSHDARKAQREQEKYLALAQGKYGQGRDAALAGYAQGTPFMDQMLGASQSLEGDLLAQIDPMTANEVRRISQEREMMQARVNQEMGARGMDSFTTRMGAQANVQGQASNAMSELAARMAGVRSSAITQGRSAYMQGLGARSQFEVNRGQAGAEGYYRQGALYGNTQVVAPTTGADIGALGAGLMSGYATSVLDNALGQATPGGGIPKEVW